MNIKNYIITDDENILYHNNDVGKSKSITACNTLNKIKSEHNFIGLSFIADDLEASEFIDDKCFGDILNVLDKDGNKVKKNEQKGKIGDNHNYLKINGISNEQKEKISDNHNYLKINVINNEQKEKIIDNHKFLNINVNNEKKEKEINEEKKEKENNNANSDKERKNRPIYSRRYYKSIRGRENQEKKDE